MQSSTVVQTVRMPTKEQWKCLEEKKVANLAGHGGSALCAGTQGPAKVR